MPKGKEHSEKTALVMAAPLAGELLIDALRKPDELILSAYIDSELRPLEHKIFNILFANALRQGDALPFYSIPLKSLVQNTNYNSRDEIYLTGALNHLQKVLLKWVSVRSKAEGEKGKARQSRSYAQILGIVRLTHSPEGEKVIEYEIHDDIKHLITNPSVYTLLDARRQNSLDRIGSMKLYEFIMSCRPKNATSCRSFVTDDIPWEHCREIMLGTRVVNGTDEFKRFNSIYLKKSIVELNKTFSPTLFSYLPVKEGRAIKRLRFVVTSCVPDDALDVEMTPARPPIDTAGVFSEMRSLGVSEWQSENLVSTVDLCILEKALSSVRKRAANQRQPPIANMDKYFVQSVGNIIRDQNLSAAASVAPPSVSALPEKESSVIEMTPSERAMKRFESMPDSIKNVIKKEFREHNKNRLVSVKFEQGGLSSKLVWTAFSRFLLKSDWFPEK
jgi:plasmid replication initiation protein